MYDFYFEARIAKQENGCWIWTRGKTKQGYGQYWDSEAKSPKYAHRTMWEKANHRLVPEGQEVCHTCDNPSCCNPAHLFLGSHNDNMQDSIKKGRLKRGHAHHKSKLTEEDVRAIRSALVRRVTQKMIARHFGVSQHVISCIKRGKIWAWLE